MLRAVVAGIVAGYGIAIPVGAIAVLIVDTGMRYGFRCAAVAGAGAATADLLYASVATVGGAVIATAVEAAAAPVRYGSATVLALMALNGLRRLRRFAPVVESSPTDRSQLLRTFGKFLGLTIINPLTVIYFTVFVVGIGATETLSALEAVVFAFGVFAASLSWQTLLAAVGAAARRRLPASFRIGATVAGNVIVLGLAVAVMTR